MLNGLRQEEHSSRQVLAKIRAKMCEKRMRCCKNYPQTGSIVQLPFVEIKPAKM